MHETVVFYLILNNTIVMDKSMFILYQLTHVITDRVI